MVKAYPIDISVSGVFANSNASWRTFDNIWSSPLRVSPIGIANRAALEWHTQELSILRSYRNELLQQINALECHRSELKRHSALWSLFEPVGDYWEIEFERLLEQSHTLRFANRARVHHAVRVAALSPRHGCQLLATIIRLAIDAEIENLTGKLRVTGLVLSALVRVASVCRSIRRIVTMQRRWYLHHGSHPIETAQSVA